MANGTDEAASATAHTWVELPRRTTFKTSEPVNRIARAARTKVQQSRGRGRTYMDAVILAALELVDELVPHSTFIDRIREIERRQFTPEQVARQPGPTQDE